MSGTVLSLVSTLLVIPLAPAFTEETVRLRDTQQLAATSRAARQQVEEWGSVRDGLSLAESQDSCPLC